MKAIRNIFLALVTMMVMVSCTHNEGDIGIWFGTWQVEGVAGPINPAYDASAEALYFQFQSDIAAMRYTSALHDEFVCYGTWHEGDNALYIDFPDTDAALYDLIGQRLGIVLPDARHLRFDIIERSSSSLRLSLVDIDGNQWTLVLKKH